MTDAKLYEVVDAILKLANDRDLQVIRQAMERRTRALHGGPMGVNPGKMAQDMAEKINSQMGYSQEMIRDMVRGFAEEIIRKNAPELSEDQIRELLKEWVPHPKKTGSPRHSILPPDALLAMIGQFIAYSTGQMSPSEQQSLRNDIPNWHERYWNTFPDGIKKLLAKFLKGELDGELFWRAVDEELSY